jgi:uncharacterized damage-inducible protein DinB
VSDPLRTHLAWLLDWEEAHVGFDRCVANFPPHLRGVRAPGFEHSAWQLVEHLRIAQADLLDFCVNASYAHDRTWPDDYWPKAPEPANTAAWEEAIAQYKRGVAAMKELVRSQPDLFALVPTGTGTQTYLRAILLAADHAAYHVGQIVAVRKALNAWP